MYWPERVLICLRYGIGDVVMELPALRAVRAHWPYAHFTVLGAHPVLELLQGDPDFEAQIGVQDFGFVHWGDRGSAMARREFGEWFMAQHFDCALDAAHAVAGIREVLLQQAAIPVRNTIADFVDPVNGTGFGAQSIWARTVRAWGLPAAVQPPAAHLFISKHADHWARRFLLQRKLKANVVGIAPIASSELKRWPIERVSEVMAWLIAHRHQRLLVFGISNELRWLGEHLLSAVQPGCVELISPRHLQETAALIRRCRAFLTNDTGLMHMAAALGTPTVAGFGPTSPQIYAPAGSIPVSAELPCVYRPKNRFGPPECVLQGRCLIAANSCIASVSTQSVIEAIEVALSTPVASLERTSRAKALHHDDINPCT